jgi:hypothetical protein
MTNEIEKDLSQKEKDFIEWDPYVLASEYGDKDAIWLLLQDFITGVEFLYPTRPDYSDECNHPIEPASLIYLKDCLVRLMNGEDARKVFPRCNDEGRQKKHDGLSIARLIVIMLRDKKAETLKDAFKMAGVQLKKSPEAIRSIYNQNLKAAEALVGFSYNAKKGQPKKKPK